jgi:hypothetical protein
MGGEGTGERLHGRAVRPFFSHVPLFHRVQGTPDTPCAGLSLRHLRQHAATTAKSFPVVWQTTKKKQNYPHAELKDYSHSHADLINAHGMDPRDNKPVKADCEREEDCADNEVTTPLPIYVSMLQHPLHSGAGWAATAPFLLRMNVSHQCLIRPPLCCLDPLQPRI